MAGRTRNEKNRVESTTQPILCCLGVTVAGLPTQFLMERAFAAQGLDWRAFSVEVAENQFQVAIDGMAAMNFAALRLFPSLEVQGAQRFSSESSLLQFVGSATSAVFTNRQWEAWNHQGFAIRNAVASRVAWEHSFLWLHGNSVRTRSLIATLAASSSKPRGILWTTPAPALDSDTTPDEIRQLASEDSMRIVESIASASECLSAALIEHDAAPTSLIIVADDTLQEAEAVEMLQVIDALQFESKIVVCQSLAGARGIVALDAVDITIAAEAYDFQRWTGFEIDTHLLRDAYDEYCDF